MKAPPILPELEAVNERLAADARGDTQRFLEQMDAWLTEHPHTGPVVDLPESLEERIQAREAAEPPPPPGEPYKFSDPFIAEIHRIRHQLSRGSETASSASILKGEPPCKD